MHVRKFEAESLDEALKTIKQELGPDAIILKTVTNKGLKGAFKKNKIEITAAISESSYVKKAEVDHVMDDQQKEKFYSNRSSYISDMINSRSSTSEKGGSSHGQGHEQQASQPAGESTNQAMNSYGKMGINKAVNTTRNLSNNLSNKMKTSLDDFLNQAPAAKSESQATHSSPVHNFHGGHGEHEEHEVHDAQALLSQRSTASQNSYPSHQEEVVEPRVSQKSAASTYQQTAEPTRAAQAGNYEENEELQEARKKIDDLERKLYDLTKNVERLDKREPTGLYQLRTTLRSLAINEFIIQGLIKKAAFEFDDETLRDQEMVFEFALREMLEMIETEMPLFSSVNSDNETVITLLISENSSGQTSMVQKLGALKEGSVVVRDRKEEEERPNFAEKIFDMDIVKTNGTPEIISQCRKGVEKNKSIFIDYKNKEGEINETKKLVDGLRRTFDKVEVLISLSAIHSEDYNRKILSRYGDLADGMVVSKLDQCLNYGSLFNIAHDYYNVPFKFYGNGEVVPDDIESATAERILAGIFKLDE